MGPRRGSGRELNLATAAPATIAEAASGQPPRQVLAAVVAATAEHFGVDPLALGPLGAHAPTPALVGGEEPVHREFADPGVAPDRLGAVHEALVAIEERRAQGVHYTPAAVADAIVRLAVDELVDAELGSGVVIDPACGGGAFLLATARLLRGRGMTAGQVLGRLHGIEIDPLSADVTVAALRLWAALVSGPRPAAGTVDGPHIRVADALTVDRWGSESGAPLLVVGNPPFGGQLERRTARPRSANDAARARLGSGSGYADTAALFLDRAVHDVDDGGVVALVQPLSLLATRDGGVVRDRIGVDRLRRLWLPEGKVFSASVAVCAPIIGPRSTGSGANGVVPVVRGADSAPVASVPRSRLVSARSWSALWAAGAGVPVVDLDDGRTVGDWCSATAGFRDEFYALAPLVVEDLDPRPDEPPEPGTLRVLTSGLVDPASTGWGRRPARLAGRDLSAPVVAIADVAAAPERRLAGVVDTRARPKVIVATQTRVVEALVDDDGRYWPSVPLISVILRSDLDDIEHRWLVAAALMSPVVTAWVLARVGGAARSPDAVKLSSRQVLQVPLPVDDERWREGAAVLAAGSAGHAGSHVASGASVTAAAPILTAAYGITGAAAAGLLRWWEHRLAGVRRR